MGASDNIMSGVRGISDAAQDILKKFPAAKIVFLSQFDQDSLIKETYRLGGRAFMTKDCDPADLAAAAGLDVVMVDVYEAIAQKGREQIGKQLGRLVEKGKMSAAGRARIAAAQKARWAKIKDAKKS